MRENKSLNVLGVFPRFLAVAVAVATIPVQAKITLAPIFTDHAVLQRDRDVAIWGLAEPGRKIAVAFFGNEAKTVAGSDGRWRVMLPAMPASREPHTLKVTESRDGWLFDETTDSVEISDVLVGEVWFCSGQSNMECPLWGSHVHFRDRKGVLEASLASLPEIRLAVVERALSAEPKFDAKVDWTPCTPQTCREFSAVGFYYGTTLYRALGVPIGLIGSYWGGTGIETWTPSFGFEAVSATTNMLSRLPNISIPGSTAKPEDIHRAAQQPTVLYNAMVAPVAPYAVRGVIWYQGCNNIKDGDLYCDKMHALYDGWCRAFEQRKMPFYLVQIAPFVYWKGVLPDDQPKLCAAQEKFARSEPSVGMVRSCDVGNVGDIHPNEKDTIGLRLAALALKRLYGFTDIIADSPELNGYELEGNAYRLRFDNVRSWYRYARTPAQFEIAGEDGVYTNAICEISGATLKVYAPGVAQPRHLQYLWRQDHEGSLYNEGSLPLGPFRIDEQGR